MQTKLEKRLSRLDAPPIPQDLQDRCVDTIPVPSATPNMSFQRGVRPFKLRGVVMASALLCVAAIGVAFLSTRPSDNGKTLSPGSMAFAQVLEASSRVTSFHLKHRVLIPIQEGVKSDMREAGTNSAIWMEETWYDVDKGLYSQSRPKTLPASGGNSALPKGASIYNRGLLLPDGTMYMRSSRSSTVYVVPNPRGATFWKYFRNYLSNQLSDNVEGRTNLNHEKNGTILSSTTGNWKGQPAQILIFERQPNQFNATHREARPVQVHFYVNPQTRLVIAEQDFAVSPGTSPALVAEYEFDYNQPNSVIFETQRLTEGATISHDLKGITKQPNKSGSDS